MGEPNNSANFIKIIMRRDNSLFRMTSIGGRIYDDGGWMSTFKVQGQVYHHEGSLVPLEKNTVPKFLQIYFISDTDAITETRCKMGGMSFHSKPRVNRGIVAGLSHILGIHVPCSREPVSYTHLTLPTIYSV